MITATTIRLERELQSVETEAERVMIWRRHQFQVRGFDEMDACRLAANEDVTTGRVDDLLGREWTREQIVAVLA